MPSGKNDALTTEIGVRRALGLTANSPRPSQQRLESPRQRRRFVQDGEVPVTVLRGNEGSGAPAQAGNRIAELEAALDAERAAHAAAARCLEEARASIRSLQTRLGHAELAFDEAIAGERRARTEAEKALQEILAAGRTVEDQPKEAVGRSSAEPPIERPPRGRTNAPRPPKAAAAPDRREPQPVKWWASSYRAKKRRR
jgi:hypothetical protein